MNTEQKIVHTHTFGCKVNLFDTSTIEKILTRNGSAKIDDKQLETPDTIVINTCTVTESADHQAKQLIRKMHRKYPQAKVVVTGCSVQHASSGVTQESGIDHIVPIDDQFKLPQILGWSEEAYDGFLPVESRRVRANLKMQNGCNAYCSFCILPYIRGRSTSIPMNEILQQAKHYADQGHHELVLTGTHIGGYGRDLLPRLRFSNALQQILSNVPDIYLRISSLEPTTLTPDVIRITRDNERIRPHFHIPLQSGSDSVLKRMNRKYKSAHFRQRIENLSAARDKMSIGTDVIVGYPGETEQEFQETLQLLQDLPITYFHVFPFSARPGTKANALEDDVRPDIKKERVRILRNLSEKKRSAYFEQFISRQEKVLVERKRDSDDLLCGITAHHVPVHFAGTDRLMAKEIDVKLLKMKKNVQAENYFLGEVI